MRRTAGGQSNGVRRAILSGHWRGVYHVVWADKEPEKMSDDRQNLPPAAQRALAEAEERRKSETAQKPPKEVGGRDGPEPVRFGDWERKGIAVDF